MALLTYGGTMVVLALVAIPFAPATTSQPTKPVTATVNTEKPKVQDNQQQLDEAAKALYQNELDNVANDIQSDIKNYTDINDRIDKYFQLGDPQSSYSLASKGAHDTFGELKTYDTMKSDIDKMTYSKKSDLIKLVNEQENALNNLNAAYSALEDYLDGNKQSDYDRAKQGFNNSKSQMSNLLQKAKNLGANINN